MKLTNRRLIAAAVIPLAVLLASCGSDAKSDSSAKTDKTAATSTTAAANSGASDAAAPTGDGCAAVPKTGSGSFDGMAQDPVATAASNNPALKTLVAAVTAAGLGDTLNGPGPFTVFAPADSAFAKIPKADLDKVLADKATLTKILTYHVIPKRIEPADLAGTYTTVEGGKLTISGDAPSFNVGDGQATVVCSGVQTANATVYIIDSVLMPPAS